MTRPTKHSPIFRRRQPPKINGGWGRLNPLLAGLYAARGAKPAETKLVLSDLSAASSLKGIDTAAKLIGEMVISGGQILICGDFDCDGCTATSVGILALKAMGSKPPMFLIPDRITMGYGLSPKLAEMAKDRGANMIITVDNGISAHAGVARARQLGLQCVVTDHHIAPETLPDADAIVNPNQPGCPFPSKNMAGVGVMFSTMIAVRNYLRTIGWFRHRQEPNLSQLLDLVAIGTIADVVKLDYNNRILVETGMQRMRKGPLRPGVQALFEVAKIDAEHLVSSDLSFRFAPRINACGRMEHMSAGIELLTSEDIFKARDIAQKLDEMNKARKDLQSEMQDEAGTMMVDIPSDTVGLVLTSPHFHEGIVGLVAGRIKEAEYRPTIAFAKAHEEGMLKGSARSIPGIHIRDVIANVDARNPGIVKKYGGHAMAAGLSIEEARFEEFKRAFDQACRDVADEDMLRHVIETDGPLPMEALNLDTAQMIEIGGPWGQGFSQPLFEGRFLVNKASPMGKEGEHVRYELTDGSNVVNAVHFGVGDAYKRKGYIDLVYQPTINRWRGAESLQLMIEHAA